MSRRIPARDGGSVSAQDDGLSVVAAEDVDAPDSAADDARSDPQTDDADETDDDAPEAKPVAAEPVRVVEDLPDPDVAAAALRALWVGFKDNADPALRERLILHYSPLV